MAEFRKYGAATTIVFPMIKAGVQDFAINTDWTPVASDTKISIDEGSFVDSTNLTVHTGGGYWRLALNSGEVTGKRTVVKIVDAATKAVEDQSIIIETYGHASAQHPFDLGTALVFTNAGKVDAAVLSANDFAQAAADKIWSSTTRTLTEFSTTLALSIWDVLLTTVTTVDSIGKLIKDNLNAAITSRSSHSAADIWSVATRLLTGGDNIVLAKGTGITGLNDLNAADVRNAVGLASANLDTQLGSLVASVDPVDVRNAVGLASANLDAQLAGLVASVDPVDVRNAVGLASANLDTQLENIEDEIIKIKNKTGSGAVL